MKQEELRSVEELDAQRRIESQLGLEHSIYLGFDWFGILFAFADAWEGGSISFCFSKLSLYCL